jgi:hypothetical protein
VKLDNSDSMCDFKFYNSHSTIVLLSLVEAGSEIIARPLSLAEFKCNIYLSILSINSRESSASLPSCIPHRRDTLLLSLSSTLLANMRLNQESSGSICYL